LNQKRPYLSFTDEGVRELKTQKCQDIYTIGRPKWRCTTSDDAHDGWCVMKVIKELLKTQSVVQWTRNC